MTEKNTDVQASSETKTESKPSLRQKLAPHKRKIRTALIGAAGLLLVGGGAYAAGKKSTDSDSSESPDDTFDPATDYQSEA